MPPGDRVTVSVTVDADPATAFVIFTEETDLWWRRGPKYRIAGRNPGTIQFEPRLGGCLTESFADQVFTTGTITAWDPPHTLQFEWRGVNFAPGEATRVEVRFEAVPTGTRVTIHHTGWAGLPTGHPVRHGRPVPVFIREMGMWWADLMTSFREKLDGKNHP
jgi:uncharacterized protein YndB with AHSA1/START domain